jgi:hypothetical protein
VRLSLLLAIFVISQGWTAEQRGLQARYYAAESKSVVERIEAVNLDWEKNPGDRPATGFLAQWHGSVEASADGPYVFRVETNGPARLVVEGRLVIDVWGRRIPTIADSTTLQFLKGRRYSVVLERLERNPPKGKSPNYIRLLWKTPDQSIYSIVPAAVLSPDMPDDPLAVTRIRFFPRKGHAGRMKGGRFTGSNDSATNGFVSLKEITVSPSEGQWSEISFSNSKVYRYIKYESPNGGWGNAAEIEFWHGKQKLNGQPFGTVGSRDDSGNDFSKALDGDTATFFDAVGPDNQYAGIDIGDENQVKAPSFTPASGFLNKPTQVFIATPTPDALIRFTTDGSMPTVLNGEICTPGGFAILPQQSKTLIARAFKQGLADSVIVTASYKPGKGELKQLKKGLVTFHTGNSLSDTVVNGGLQTVTRSAGINHTVLKATIPGAPTDFLWGAFTKNPAKAPLVWLKEKAPVDVLITQPFAGHGRTVENETENTGNFFKECRKYSPKAQLWIYQQWSDPDRNDGWAKGRLGLGKANEHWKSLLLQVGEKTSSNRDLIVLQREPAKTYDQAIANHRRYFEILRDELCKTFPDQTVPIIPGGQALAALKREMDAGKVPGLRDFFNELYADGIHMSAKGHYLISLVFLSSLYRQSFVDEVTDAASGLTPEQTRIFQRIAWEAVVNEPLSSVGLSKKIK